MGKLNSAMRKAEAILKIRSSNGGHPSPMHERGDIPIFVVMRRETMIDGKLTIPRGSQRSVWEGIADETRG
jgi:hypothetical protein